MKIDLLKIGLDPILHFESIARLESLKGAANELHLSQPAITQSLSRLEKSLGTQLCVRSRASFSLTETGRRLFKLSQEIKGRLKTFESFIAEDEGFDGLLSIGVIDNFQNDAFEAAVKKTIQRFPNMRLSVQVHSAGEVQALVASGEVDVGLGIFNRKLDQLTYRVVGAETIRHYIAENHPLFSKREVNRGDIKGHAKTWVDIISRNRSALEVEIFADEKIQIAPVNSYANNLNTAVLILQSGTSIVPIPAEYLEGRKLNFKYRPLNSTFPPYSLKQEAAIHGNFLGASPAAKFFFSQLPKV